MPYPAIRYSQILLLLLHYSLSSYTKTHEGAGCLTFVLIKETSAPKGLQGKFSSSAEFIEARGGGLREAFGGKVSQKVVLKEIKRGYMGYFSRIWGGFGVGDGVKRRVLRA